MLISIIVPVYNNARFVLEAMESVKEQNIDDLELIIINDGSTDNTEEVIDKFVSENPFAKKITQKNQGVSAARNAGLDMARGKYIGFLDSDDAYQENALSDMLYVAECWNADLVVGEHRSVGTFKTVTFPRVQELSKKTHIKQDDLNFIYNFSTCNKLFLREIIEKNNLRFSPIKVSEDALFLFSFLRYCNTITGCPKYIYDYNKRIILDAQSAMKSLDESMLSDAISSLKTIEKITDSYSSVFKNELYIRILRVSLINEFYRRLWTLDENAERLLFQHISQYRKKLSDDIWDDIVELSLDLELKDGLKDKSTIAQNPLISILIPFGLKSEDYKKTIKTLYYQLCPNFEVIVDSRYSKYTDDSYSDNCNFHYSSSDLIQTIVMESRGKYVQIITEPCIFAEDSLQMMLRNIVLSQRDFVSVRPMLYNNGNTLDVDEVIDGYDELFGAPIIIDDTARSARNKADNLWCNKLFCRESLVRLLQVSPVLDKANNYYDFLQETFKRLTYKRFRKDVIGIINTPPVSKKLAKQFLPIEKKIEEKQEKKSDRFRAFMTQVHNILYWICRTFIPIRKKDVLFLSDIRSSLGGNYAPLYSPLKKAGFHVILDFKESRHYNEGYRQILRRSYHLATARFIVLEDVHSDLPLLHMRSNQELVQLWHAAGAYKRFGFSRAIAGENIEINTGYRKTTKAIVSAESIRKDYAEAFGIDISKVVATGVPRTDILYDTDYIKKTKEKYEERYPQIRGKKILLISPTYRGSIANAKYDVDQLDPGRIHEVLGDDYILIFKWHPAMYSALKRKKKAAYDYSQYGSYTLDLSHERDVNELLMISDIVITDYSSIIFEYELLNKPLIFYLYDANSYMMQRGTYYDLDKYVYGSVAYTFEELLDALSHPDYCAEERKVFHSRFMEACDGNASQRVVDQIFKK